jgi:hypothetical protein
MPSKSIFPSFQSKASSRHRRSNRNLRLEQLENRELMSVTSSPIYLSPSQHQPTTPMTAIGHNMTMTSIDYHFDSGIFKYLNIERDFLLNAPSNLRSTDVRSNSLTLNWNDNSFNERGFNIQYRQGNTATWSNLGSVGPDSTSCVVYGMLPQNTYYFRVDAWNNYQTTGYTSAIAATTRCSNYAVLFSGGISVNKNYDRYYNNIKSMYQTLTVKCNVEADNIYVVYADGTNTAADQYGNINSDMTFASGAHVLSATQANLTNTLTTLAGLVTSSDNFLFYSFDHGSGTLNSPGTTGEEVLCGWGQNIADDVLAPALQGIHSAHSSYVFAECFSGGMLDDLLPVGNTNYGCAATNHYEYSMEDGFAAGFVGALQNGKQKTADIYKYAVEHDSYAVTTSYAANGGAYLENKEHPWQTGSNFTMFQPHVYFNSAFLPPDTEFPSTTGKQNSNSPNSRNSSLTNACRQILATNWTTSIPSAGSVTQYAQVANNPQLPCTNAKDTTNPPTTFSGSERSAFGKVVNMQVKSLENDLLRNFSVPAAHSTDACFELLGVDDVKINLLDNCRPGKMTAAISALATNEYYNAIHSQGRS